MSLEKIIEEKLRQAIENGEFDNLEGAGKPLNLDDYFATPEEFRVGQALLKSNKFVPEEVDLLKEIGQLKEKIIDCEDELEKTKLRNLLNEKTLALTLILERNKLRKKKKADYPRYSQSAFFSSFCSTLDQLCKLRGIPRHYEGYFGQLFN